MSVSRDVIASINNVDESVVKCRNCEYFKGIKTLSIGFCYGWKTLVVGKESDGFCSFWGKEGR
jgi:hypothetical protein